MAEEDPTPERAPSCHEARDASDGGAYEQPQELPSPNAHQIIHKKGEMDTSRRPAFLSCKWPEGTDWCVDLASELQALGMPFMHDAKHRAKVHDVEESIRDCSCVVMLVTPGFFHGLANKPPGNRALKEIKMALHYGKTLLAVIHASYCGQNPLPSLMTARELTSDSGSEPAWTTEELSKVAHALPIFAFKGGDGFMGYQRELIRQVSALTTAARTTENGESETDADNTFGSIGGSVVSSVGASAIGSSIVGISVVGGGSGGSGVGVGGSTGRSPGEAESEEKRLREVLRAAGLARRLPSLLEGHIRSLRTLEKALRKGRLSNKPFNWHDSWIQRVIQVLEAWPVMCTMPDWLRAAPEGLVALLAPLLAQEESRDFDRDGKPRPRRGALPPSTILDLAGQGPVVVGPRGAAAVAAMVRDVGSAQAAAAQRQQQYQQQVPSRRRLQLHGTATTMLTLTHVDLSDCDLGTAGAVDVLAAVPSCPSIRALLLGGNSIGDDVTKEFESIARRASASASASASANCDGANAGPLTGLRTLGLDRNALTDAGAATMVSILYDYNVGVTALDLSGNVGLSTATAEALVRSLRGSGSRRLTWVGLMGTQLDEAALVALLPVLLSQQQVSTGTASRLASEELDLSGNTVDSEALAALATAARQPGYSGGPRAMNLSGANLRMPLPSRRHTMSAEPPNPYYGYGNSGCGGNSSSSSGNVSSLAAALHHSYNLEELRLSWCGLSGAGLRTLLWTLSGGKPQHPLPKLTVLDLTGNKLGPEGVALLGALLPVNLPSLRHLVLDECGLGGRELGLLAGMFDVAPWVVHALQGAICKILGDNITGAAGGSWMQPLDDSAWGDRPRPWVAFGAAAAAAACTALEVLLRSWLAMDDATAAVELKRLLLPPGAAAAAAAAFASPHSMAARKAAAIVSNSGSGRLAGLACLLVHPVVQPVLEALRDLWEAVQAEKDAPTATPTVATAGGLAAAAEARSRSPIHSPDAISAVRALDAAFLHLRSCAEVPGLTSLSLGRNSLAQEAGAPLGAAVSLSNGVRHLGLHGIVQPPPPAPVAGTGAAAAAAAAAAAQGGPLAAAAAAARDARALLRLLYSAALAPTLPNPFAMFRQAHQISAANWAQPNSSAPPSRKLTRLESQREPTNSTPDGTASGLAAAPEPRSLSDLTAVGQSFMPGLRSLDLTDAGINSHNAPHLAEFVRHLPCLEQIVLDFNSLSCSIPSGGGGGGGGSGTSDGSGPGSSASPPEGAAALFADLAALPSLSYVSLNYACDTGAMFGVADHLLGLAVLPPSLSTSMSGVPSGQPGCPSLRVLSLVGCPLDVVVARRLARALLHNTSLAVLRLGGGDPPEGVGPIGSRALGEALTSHRGLVELSLSGVGLTDNAARMLADALPQLSQLCKLDLSYNSFTSYGLEGLAGALLARNRNAVGAAAENRLSMHVYGNRVSEELETRIQALSVPPSMTHATDRMPSVRRYGAPPPSRGEMGGSGGGSGYTGASPYASSYNNYVGSTPRSGGSGGLPAAPSLVPSPMLVRAPLPRPAPPQMVQSKGPRCASSPPRSSTAPQAPTHPGLAAAAVATATAPADPSRPLGSGKPTLLTAIPPPLPARRGSRPSEEGNGLADSLDFSVRMTYTSASKLTKIYGGGTGSPPLSPSGAGGGGYLDNGRRGSPGVPGQGPMSSPAPALKTLPMGISQMRAIVPGAPYAAALANAGNNPLLNGNRNRPTAGSISGNGAASDSHYGGSSGGGGTLPAVRKSYPLAEGTSASGASETDDGNGNGDGSVTGNGGENANGGKGRKPRVHGASDHLMLRTKCHTPDWVNRMQEDFYKKVTAPPRPTTPPGPPPAPPGPPSEHLFRKLLCHDSDWQRTKQMEQFMRETAPEPKPQPVPGAPVSSSMVSSVALIQRSSGAPRSNSPPAGTAVRSPYRPVPDPEPVLEPISEPDTAEQPALGLESELQGRAVKLEDKSQQVSTSGGETEEADAHSPEAARHTGASGGTVPEGMDDSPAQLSPSPPPPAGGVSTLLAGLSGRACGTSGNLGSEESMEVLAVRNTGRKKAAIEVLRIRKAKDGEGGGAGVASGDGGASGDGDEEGDDDGAPTERDHVDGDVDGDGNVSSRDGRETGGETDGSGEGGCALRLPESNPDGKDHGYAEEAVGDAAAEGSGREDEQRADGGDLAGEPHGGEGDSESRAAPSRGSNRSSSNSSRNSSSANEDLGEMHVRDGDAEAEAEAEAAEELGGSAEEERSDGREGDAAAAPDGVRGEILGYLGNGPLSPVVSAS